MLSLFPFELLFEEKGLTPVLQELLVTNSALWISQALVVIVNVPHGENITAALKSQAVSPINIGFKHARCTRYWVAA